MLINAVENVFHSATDLMVKRIAETGPSRLAKVAVVVGSQFKQSTVIERPAIDVPVLARMTERR
jgi:hypothetical protein